MSDAKKVNFEIKTKAAKKVVAVRDPFLTGVNRKKSLTPKGSASKSKSSKKLDTSKNIDHLEK